VDQAGQAFHIVFAVKHAVPAAAKSTKSKDIVKHREEQSVRGPGEA
jgi:hypothetical protein